MQSYRLWRALCRIVGHVILSLTSLAKLIWSLFLCSLMKTGLASFTVGDFLIAASRSSNNPLPPSSSRVCTEPAETSAQALTLTNAWFWSPELVWIYHTHIKIKHNIREALIKPYQTHTWQDYDLSIKLPEELWFNILVHNPLFISLYRTERKKILEQFPPSTPFICFILSFNSSWQVCLSISHEKRWHKLLRELKEKKTL